MRNCPVMMSHDADCRSRPIESQSHAVSRATPRAFYTIVRRGPNAPFFLFVGFPRQCPTMCPCETYDCRGGFKETCGFSEGFCQMILATPVEYKVNWVRVYQDKADPRQKVGCSTPERPTKKFIEAHEKKYKLEGDVSLFFVVRYIAVIRHFFFRRPSQNPNQSHIS